ncbi:MAG: ribosome biogenesis GTPase Der [Alphaproteobacteria bacterium]
MPLPIDDTAQKKFFISLVGRTNVGKSTLFNRLVIKNYERPQRLTANRAGLTRDVAVAPARLFDAEFMLADTIGFQPLKDKMDEDARKILYDTIASSNLLLFMVDGLVPLNRLDWQFAEWIARQQHHQPIDCAIVVNKGEAEEKLFNTLAEVASLLAKHPINRVGGAKNIPLIHISANHGLGMDGLYELLVKTLPTDSFMVDEKTHHLGGDDTDATGDKNTDTIADEHSDIIMGDNHTLDKKIKLAILGRPNVGKSTLTNRLLERLAVLTDDRAGTTRDATYHDIKKTIQHHAMDFQVIDTAGIRRKSSISEDIEKKSVGLAMVALRFAHVALLMIDATSPLTQQDMAIIKNIIQQGRPLCLVLNKWDLVTDKRKTKSNIERQVGYLLPRVKGLPIVSLSAIDKKSTEGLWLVIKQLHDRWSRHIETNKLNRWLRQAIEKNPPPSHRGLRAKINYMVNSKSRPPHFVLFLTRKFLLHENYLRYLENNLRDEFDLAGIPIRWTLRVKKNPYGG